MAVSPDTFITTSQGIHPVETLVGCDFRVWTGLHYHDASVTQIGVRPVGVLTLKNGLRLRLEPEHPVLVVPFESGLGEPEWRPLKALKPKDHALIAYRREDHPLDTSVLFAGKDYLGWTPGPRLLSNVSFWHMLGYALGSGYFPDPTLTKEAFRIFAGNRRHCALLDQFEQTCEDLHIPVIASEGDHPMITVFEPGFQRWLRDLGFRSAGESPTLPSRFFHTPAWMREALLRGFFTARGVWDDTTFNAPLLRVHEPALRQSVLRCLWSVGVASHEHLGDYVPHKIRVSDIDAFNEQIRFLLDDMNREATRVAGYEHRWDVLPVPLAQAVIRQIMTSKGWADLHYNERERIAKLERRGLAIRRPMAREFLRKVESPLPAPLRYHFAKIGKVEAEPVAESLMYAVEVADDARTFIGNHVALGDSNARLQLFDR